MRLTHLIQQILDSGVLSRRAEKQVFMLLEAKPLTPTEIAYVNRLMDAIAHGAIRAVA